MTATSMDARHDWARLNRLQLGKYAEYLVKMEFLLWGCEVFTSEVDDRGIDFVIRTAQGRHFDVQVKSFRLGMGKNTPYVCIRKDKFRINRSLLLVLVQFEVGEAPVIWMIPSLVKGGANPLLESRDYGEGRKSLPEWGLTLSRKKLAQLAECCSFEAALRSLGIKSPASVADGD